MPLTPNFVKALTFCLGAIILLYLSKVGMDVAGMDGISISSTNSFLRISLNHLISLAGSISFWVAVMILTKEKLGCYLAITLKSMLYGYTIYQFSTTLDAQATFETLTPIRTSGDIACYAIFGLLHFKSPKGLLIVSVWAILFGFTTGIGFNLNNSFFNRILDIVDLEDLFTINIRFEEGGNRSIDLLRRLINEMYLLFNLVIFWFVYTLIKAGKSFDLSLRTIDLNPRINQLMFSLIYWPMRVFLFVSIFGIAGLLAISFQKGVSTEILFNLLCTCFSVFVIGSIYRNFLTDYMVSKGRPPGWLYFLLNIPVLSFVAWIYTFFIPNRPQPTPAFKTEIAPGKNQNNAIPESASSNIVEDETAEPLPSEYTDVTHDTINEYIPTDLQLDFKDYGKNNSIKIILILASTGLIIMQYKNTSMGYVRPDTGQTEFPFMLALITLGLTIWYLYDWKAFLTLLFLQTLSILMIATFQLSSVSSLIAASGIVNMIVYYALFHFDHLKLMERQVADEPLTQDAIT